MPRPFPDAQLDFPYDSRPEARVNTNFISDATLAREIDNKQRASIAATAQALENAGANFAYFDDQLIVGAQAPSQAIRVYYDEAAEKGDIMFPVDIQEVSGETLFTVRKTPRSSNPTSDAIGMCSADTEVGSTALVLTRGLIQDIPYPRTLESDPNTYDVAIIGNDGSSGWQLREPQAYGETLLQSGQKLIGTFLNFRPGPPALYDILLTGFQQSNYEARSARVTNFASQGQLVRIPESAAAVSYTHLTLPTICSV